MPRTCLAGGRYKWKDQPAWRTLRAEYPDKYTDAYMDKWQAKVEAMHRNYPTATGAHDAFDVDKDRPKESRDRPLAASVPLKMGVSIGMC